MSEVTGQAIAEVDERANRKVNGHPARLFETRFEVEMLSGNGTAQFSADEDRIAWLRAGAAEAFVSGDRANERDGDEDSLRVGGRLATGDGDTVLSSERVHAGVDVFDELWIEIPLQADGDKRRGWRAGHRGNVTETAGERFATDLLRRRFLREVNSFDDGVGLKKDEPIRHAQVEHGAIVARASDDAVVARQGMGQPTNEFQFVHLTNASTIRLFGRDKDSRRSSRR